MSWPAMCDQEIFGKFDQDGCCLRVVRIADKEIDSCVLGRYPNAPVPELAFEVRADEILSGVNCEQWFHLLLG